MRKLSIEIEVPEGSEDAVRTLMAQKVLQLYRMISGDGPEAFCWSGGANDVTGKMKFAVSTPIAWSGDSHYGLQKDGVYRHFKGNEYVVLGFGWDTETSEVMVIYRRIGQTDSPIWIRSTAMFAQNVIVNGNKEIPRFTLIGACVHSQSI